MLKTYSDADAIPDSILLYAQKGWGKSTFAAYAPKPIILMSANELGWLTLRRNNSVPDAPYAIIKGQEELMVQLQELIVKGVGDRETLVLDALGGIEAMYCEMVCRTKYGNDFAKFMAYYAGYGVVISEIGKLLEKLDEIRSKLKLRIILLAHDRVEVAPNPMGAEFKQYTVDVYEKTAKVVKRWADMLLFGHHASRVAKVEGDNKGIGDGERELFCSFQDCAEAGNRHGLPHRILMPKKPSEMWSAFAKFLPSPVAAKVEPAVTEGVPPEQRSQGVKEAEGAAFAADANLMELQALVAQNKLETWVKDKLLPKYRVDSLAKLTDAQVTEVIGKIKEAATKKAAKAA
jgi:hypothetical protein